MAGGADTDNESGLFNDILIIAIVLWLVAILTIPLWTEHDDENRVSCHVVRYKMPVLTQDGVFIEYRTFERKVCTREK